MTRLGILLSGRGSNFQAIHRAVERGEIEAEIALVVSNVPEAAGLKYAREAGLPVWTMSSKGVPRAEFDRKVLEALREAGVEWVCLAGYMRLLSPEFIAAYAGRIVNIHPSLLPSFPGLDAQEQAFRHGVKITGCTVHLVDEGLDTGPILAQSAVPVLEGDTVESLSARILEAEHKLYPATMARLVGSRKQ